MTIELIREWPDASGEDNHGRDSGSGTHGIKAGDTVLDKHANLHDVLAVNGNEITHSPRGADTIEKSHASRFVGTDKNMQKAARERAQKIRDHRAVKLAKESDIMIDYELKYVQEREFDTKARDKAAKSGTAMPDGSFPIENQKDLENAVKAIGRAKDPSAAKAHIKSRAKALGCTDCIPNTWESWQTLDGELVCEASFPQSDSHDGLAAKLGQCVDGKVMAGGHGEQMQKERASSNYPNSHVQAVHDKHVIYSAGGKNFAHKYEVDSEGDPHLKGDPQEVEPSYQSKKTAAQESFAESFMFLAPADGVQFAESYDAAKGELTLTIIKPGWSKNNRYYSALMLARDHKVFEGNKMFADHQTDKESSARPEGSVNNWMASVKKTWAEKDGTVRGTAVVIDPQFKAKLASLAEHGLLNTMGVSIRAMGQSKDGEAEGRKGKIIEGIKAARSVDFVTFAGAGGQVEQLQ